jgi:hypothetical protein
MEALTVLLLFAVTIAGCLLVFCRDQKRAHFLQLIEKLPGPIRYPVFGTVLPFLFVSPQREYIPACHIIPEIAKVWSTSLNAFICFTVLFTYLFNMSVFIQIFDFQLDFMYFYTCILIFISGKKKPFFMLYNLDIHHFVK